MIVPRRPLGPPPFRGAPGGDSTDAMLATLFGVWGVLFTLGGIGCGVALINNPAPGDWGLTGLFGLLGIALAPFGVIVAFVCAPQMLRGDRRGYRHGGWLCMAPIVLGVPAVPLLFAVPYPALATLVVVLTALWFALAVALIRRSVTANSAASHGSVPVAVPIAVPLSGPGPHDALIALAFRVLTLLVAAYGAITFVQTFDPLPPGMTQSFIRTIAAVSAVGAIFAVGASFIFSPFVARGDLRVIRGLAIFMLIAAAPNGIGMLVLLTNPVALVSMLFSLPGVVQLLWIAVTGLLLVRSFSDRPNPVTGTTP